MALQDQQKAERDKESRYQKRLAQIRKMPPEQQAEAIRKLSQDYPGRTKRAEADVSAARDTIAAGGNAKMRSGPSGNPYAVNVAANPLEHLADGMRGYNAMKDKANAEAVMEGLSTDKESANADLMAAGMPNNADDLDITALLRAPDASQLNASAEDFGAAMAEGYTPWMDEEMGIPVSGNTAGGGGMPEPMSMEQMIGEYAPIIDETEEEKRMRLLGLGR